MFKIEIYIISDVMIRNHDGTCRYYIKAIKDGKVIKEQGYRMSFDCTTRHRSYLEAALAALSRMKISKFECSIFCDFRQCVSDSVDLFERAEKKFRRGNGIEYANADLWRRLKKMLDGHAWSWNYMGREDIEKRCQISEIR